MKGVDMVEAANLLGIEAMTGHWEFTLGENVLRDNVKAFKGEFLAQSVFLTEEAAFNDAPAFDSTSGRVFKPATTKEVGGYRIGVIGQALPYVPIAHSETIHARLDLRYSRRRHAEGRRRVAEQRQGRRSALVVAQRHGCRPQACQPRHRHRCHPGWPHP